MEDDGRHDPFVARKRGCGRGAVAHGGEGARNVARGAAGQARMNADRGIEIGIGGAHDRRRRAAGRQARHVDARRVDGMVEHDLSREVGDQAGLAFVPALVAGAEPVPALVGIRRLGLLRIGDEDIVRLGELVHARARREILRRLRAAVQHDEQRHRLPAMAGGDVEPEAAPASRAPHKVIVERRRGLRRGRDEGDRGCARGSRKQVDERKQHLREQHRGTRFTAFGKNSSKKACPRTDMIDCNCPDGDRVATPVRSFSASARRARRG